MQQQQQHSKKSNKIEASATDELDSQIETIGQDTRNKPLYDLGVEWKDLDLRKFFAVGSSVYALECALVYPFDLLKTQLQVEKGSTSFFSDAIAKTKNIYRTQGIRGMYRGYLTSTLGSLPSYAVYILLYNYLKDMLERHNPQHRTRGHDVWVTALAGGICDIASHLIFVPVDVVVQRLQLPNSPYKNPFDVVRHLVNTGGYTSLYRGFGATIVVGAPASAIWWTTYETLKRYLSDNDPREKLFGYRSKKLIEEAAIHSHHHVQNYFAQSTAGVLAGAFTCIVENPLDVVKTRLQTQSRRPGEVYYRNIFSGLATMVKTEGFKSLWKGVGPRVLSMAPVSGFSTLIYEFVMKTSRKSD